MPGSAISVKPEALADKRGSQEVDKGGHDGHADGEEDEGEPLEAA